MDSELEIDLLEAFDGVDPSEFIAEDPILASLMEDVISDECKDPSGAGKGSLYTCTVCNGPSRGNRYYGAIACTSCRSFFGRAVKEEAYKAFLCSKGLLDCKIDSKSWMSCQLCRFKQCLASGMKIPSTESGTTSITSTTTTISTIKKTNKDLNHLLIIDMLKHCVFPPGILDDKLEIDRLARLPLEVGTKVITSLCRSDSSIFSEMLDFMYLGRMYTTRTRKQIADSLKYFGTQVYVDSGDLSESPFGLGGLSKMDKMRLANGNIPLVTEYALAGRLGKLPDYKLEVDGYIEALTANPDEDFSSMIKGIYSKYSKVTI